MVAGEGLSIVALRTAPIIQQLVVALVMVGASNSMLKESPTFGVG
jgi:hypothetical protein